MNQCENYGLKQIFDENLFAKFQNLKQAYKGHQIYNLDGKIYHSMD